MKRRILIDGYNLIHCIPSCKQKLSQDLEGARKDLLDRLASLAARKGWEIRTVFDGGSHAPDGQIGRPGIKVVFSRWPEKADHVIKREIAGKGKNEDVLVVSSDAEITGYARLHGIPVMSSRDFAASFDKGNEKELPDRADPVMNKDGLKEWMDLFSGRKDPGP